MINELRHEEARNALEALALDALDAAERAAVLAHVDGCSICRHELAALEKAAAELAYAVRPEPMSDASRDRVKNRLMSRVARRSDTPRWNELVSGRIASPRPSGESPVAHDGQGAKPLRILVPHAGNEPLQSGRTRIASPWAWTVAAAATLVAAVSLASLYQVTRERDLATAALRNASVDRSGGRDTLDALRASLEARDRVIANLTGPDVAVMTLASTGPNAPSARMFWNQSINAWTFVAHHLPKLSPGRRYQLWFVTKKQKLSAGTFAIADNGDAMMQATYVLPKDAQLEAVAVTDEPEAGSPQPTTTPVIVGSASAR